MGRDHSGDTLGLGDVLTIGSFNLVCVLGGFGLGWWADSSSGLTPVMTLLGLAAGVAVGVGGTWLRVRPFLREGVAGDQDRTDDG